MKEEEEKMQDRDRRTSHLLLPTVLGRTSVSNLCG